MSELFQAVIASDEKTDLRQFVSDLLAGFGQQIFAKK